jgi:hypothetical protein
MIFLVSNTRRPIVFDVLQEIIPFEPFPRSSQRMNLEAGRERLMRILHECYVNSFIVSNTKV